MASSSNTHLVDSSTNLAESCIQAKIKEKLRIENVKLWMTPFYDQESKAAVDGEIMALAGRYCCELEITESEVVDGLYALQRHALERLEERDFLKATGLSTLRIKFSGFTSERLKGIERLQINLSSTGETLRGNISQAYGIEGRFKLISQGKVIKEVEQLEQQNIKNGALIMVLSIIDPQGFERDEQEFRQLEETRDSVNYLSGKSLGDQFSLQITDQSGKTLDLPESEKKAIAMALALHEKGRSAMKLNDYTRALIFLLEADMSYNQCHSEILNAVDNYGLLNLDIAWCYLSLQSIGELPAIEARLKNCEKVLHKSYGENLERVIALKGSAGWEAALFVRLHLLQGIVAYHLGQIEKAKFYVTKANDEINRLKISDEQLASLINMGYDDEESRIALRSTNGDIGAAVDNIIRRLEEKTRNREHDRELAQLKRLQDKLGKCENGDPVDIGLFKTMTENMSFNPILSKAALKTTNNDIGNAIQLVTAQDFISQAIKEEVKISQQQLQQQQQSTSTSTSADQPTTSTSTTSVAVVAPTTTPTPSQTALTTSVSTIMLNQLTSQFFAEHAEPINPEEIRKSQKAYENLSHDLHSEGDYIDLNLTAESQYLEQYKNLMNIS